MTPSCCVPDAVQKLLLAPIRAAHFAAFEIIFERTMTTTLHPDQLTENQRDIADFYAENGFYVYHGALSPAEVEQLRAECVRICAGELGSVRGTSAGRAQGESDDELLRRFLCIHFPHKASDLMLRTLAHPTIVETLTACVSPNVKAMQSMLFIKASGKPGQAWHQDEDYIPTRDRSLVGAWIALDDATIQNGCLWIIPGSHKPGILWDQEWHGDRRFDCSLESRNFPYQDEDAVPVEVKAGTIVFFNGYTLHRSLPNTAKSGYRRALVNHYMSAESFLPWFSPRPDNARDQKGMAKLDHRDIVMIAGKDPYAHHGLENRQGVFVRADGKGGCSDGLDYED